MDSLEKLSRLEQLVGDIGAMQKKLILLVGPSRGGKSKLLQDLGNKLQIKPVSVGSELGRQLATTPHNKRGFSVGDSLRDLGDRGNAHRPLLIDNIELLFERSLQINPLELIKRLAHSRCVVAVWPGELRDGRLIYADRSHPEHRDYGSDGVVFLEI